MTDNSIDRDGGAEHPIVALPEGAGRRRIGRRDATGALTPLGTLTADPPALAGLVATIINDRLWRGEA